ncbi:sugar phosphate nucleotidyltransferase [Chloracidobacterium thermophilum]|jgi:NDP-sugar pyrophosphorylase family protein|uniref:Nucleoside-diphosphate-sugar pyrophosphorylase involved in lipopolysaccharide biosynthesis/translation initiation factor 2B, gamma/epsilon subunits (EIF-2Bgamma/eIF-2Bepsilon) n=1 Tax=Chloracidobacterium thermophilum (strain B) TaxID=981222 RepID=G2LH99_CHLTF|nr:NDP-sugar synthase [Chloracidobacterium thermophilum]AEP11841.1 Nucleoside-diphosphate-sugar pyrophosphorylase involved in lipopolysaccharide biosynthesis/translation initiation factor 2B, gamma/epsilon subunits (eIF-2Bgamma/eIF-2Bepsilon) [Chloracidobacterium thermophilum B]
MKAMLLAAGFGTRLFPLTLDRPKPALPVLGRPLIAYGVDYLTRFGCRDLVVNLHYRGEAIVAVLGDGASFGCRIAYSHESDEILGTGGALDHARPLLNPTETFVVMNGKLITTIDLQAALATHRRQQALATLILKPNRRRERFSVVEVDNTGAIRGFAPPPDAAVPDPPPLFFTGIQILEPEIFDYIPRARFSHTTTDVYPRAIADGQRVVAHVAGPDEDWYEFSTLERYLDLSCQLAGHPQAVIRGQNCQVAADARLVRTILWNHVTIGAKVELHEVIVGDGVTIPEATTLSRAAVVRADRLEVSERARAIAEGRGRQVGENFIVHF